MICIDKNNEGLLAGDKVRLTGQKDDTTYSITLHEFEFLEGQNKGEKIWNSLDAELIE